MATVRVSQTVSVQNPDPRVVEMIGLHEGQAFDDKDPIVKAYPWAFESDNIERTTAAPGEKRNVKR